MLEQLVEATNLSEHEQMKPSADWPNLPPHDRPGGCPDRLTRGCRHVDPHLHRALHRSRETLRTSLHADFSGSAGERSDIIFVRFL